MIESTQPPQTRPLPYLDRAVADSRDRAAWLAAREPGIGASDAAKFANIDSAPGYLRSKLHSGFGGNAATRHGTSREAGMLAHYRIPQNFTLFHAEGNPRHLATPDGIVVSGMTGEVVLAECKTMNKPFRNISPAYWRQCQWQMYVMGAERVLFIYEVHEEFRPVAPEPESIWLARDDEQIATLITIADRVLEGMDLARAFREGITS